MSFEEERNLMLQQLIKRGITDENVLQAMRELPRHLFVPEKQRKLSYEDRPLPIGHGQTISQPYVVALMSQMLALQTNEKVLEIGTGSAYQAAILAALSREVHSIERIESLALQAQSNLDNLDIKNVHIHIGDGSLGWPQESPYDAIIVTAAAPSVPETLLNQLSPTGRLLMPVGGAHRQTLQKCWRKNEGFHHKDYLPVAFVPLIGEHGWDESPQLQP